MKNPLPDSLSPGSTIGILGGGQLGRMLAIAAAQLGYKCHIYAPDKISVAAEVAGQFTCADYTDLDALSIFAKSCDIITYEFENVPVAPLRAIANITPVRPDIRALEISQDRAAEKEFAIGMGGETAPFAIANDAEGIATALSAIGPDAIAKTVRMGYDGKGQARLSGETMVDDIWRELGEQPLIIEKRVGFDAEFSVILARDAGGNIDYWDCPRNNHVDGILSQSTLPAGPLVESQIAAARTLAAAIADRLGYIGVMTCEFFATQSAPVFNEMAPRVHNSGHWTIEGAMTSQFENHIRAICGLPLGDSRTVYGRVEMENLIGDDILKWERIMADPAAHIHIYGKGAPRPGRKMGHVTRLYP